MTNDNDIVADDTEAKRAFMRKLIEVYNVPMNLVRYETMDSDGSGSVPVEET